MMPRGPCDEVENMSLKHEMLLPYIRIFRVLRPRNRPVPYVRWELNPTPQIFERVFESLGLNRDILAQLRKSRRAFAARLHAVFPEAHNGLHYGRWLAELCARSSRVTGLFIQSFGDL